jgi:hypothetical protein
MWQVLKKCYALYNRKKNLMNDIKVSSEEKISKFEEYQFDHESLLIIIDPWEGKTLDQNQIRQNLCQKIINRSSLIPNLRAVVLSSYETTDYLYDPSEYHKNSADLFFNNQPLISIRKQFKETYLDNAAEKSCRTHRLIYNHIWSVNQYAALETWQIVYLLNRTFHRRVKNIFYAGLFWDYCIKDRPVGWKEILSYSNEGLISPEINFYFIQDMQIDNGGKPKDLAQEWFTDLRKQTFLKEVTKDIFQLDKSRI